MAAAQSQPPQAKSELVIDQIKKAVAFLQGTYSATRSQLVNGIPTQVPIQGNVTGTGFFIYVPEPRLGENRGVTYFVTNKHLIREPGPTGISGEGPFFDHVVLRLNTLVPNPDGTQFAIMNAQVVDQSGSLGWFVDPEDETVDLAITPVSPNDALIDYKTIQVDLFATKNILKEKQVNENDEILFAGLFAWHPGTVKNYPIIRHGKLSRLFEERIPLNPRDITKTVEVHLADVMSFGGNSGSPVFLRIGGLRETGAENRLEGYSYYLLGVMKGYFPENLDFAIDVAEVRGSVAQNSGIAAVIPVDKILEILNKPRVLAFRERVVANEFSKSGNLQGAEVAYKAAIESLEKCAPKHTDLASTLIAYARFLRAAKRTNEAEGVENRAKAILSNAQRDRMHPRM